MMTNQQDLDQAELDARLADIKKQLTAKGYSESQLINYCALLIIKEETQDMHIAELNEAVHDYKALLEATHKKFMKWYHKPLELIKALEEEMATIPARLDHLVEIEKRNRARKLGVLSHKKTYELRDKIIAYWRDNISADKTNEFAAELLQKEFPAVAHRTLAKYVAAAKKLLSAGTL